MFVIIRCYSLFFGTIRHFLVVRRNRLPWSVFGEDSEDCVAELAGNRANSGEMMLSAGAIRCPANAAWFLS